MARDDRDEQDNDPRAEYGGDKGVTHTKGKGVQAEKGDQRRDEPVHSGPTRQGSQGKRHEHGKRSGSDSNEQP